MSHTHQQQDFRSRLQHTLSLSSPESKKTSSPLASKEGDIIEYKVLQDKNDCSNDQENSNSADKSKEALQERRKKCRYEKDIQKSKQT